ncbi:MAG: phytoene desaturase family protein [Verrucomicrobiota bacterium]|nr:phytoene desaturase family protein [Verrucomicrobiota bacterium]
MREGQKSYKTAIIVGAGFGGIATALRLRRLGYEVTIIDNNSRAGGRAQVYEIDGFKFDAGPTVITAPFLFDDLFALFGKDRKDYVEFLRVEPWYRFEFSDGSKLDYGGSLEDTIAEIDRLSPGEGKGYDRLVNFSKAIFKIGFEKLSDQPFHKFWIMVRQVPALIALKSYLSVYSLVSKFLKDERLRRAFSIHPLLVGGNPMNTTSIYCLIHFLERKWGVWFPRGGTGSLVDALVKLMHEQGIQIELNSSASEVLVENNKAVGIRKKNGHEERADLVIFDADPAKVYRKLIDERYRKKWTNRRIDGLTYSMGLFVWYFGTSRSYPEVKHHTIIMGETFKELLEEIYDQKVLSDDLSLYLHRPAATDPAMAPDGGDAFYVLAPVPNKKANIDWEKAGEKIRLQVEQQLESTLLPGLRQCTEVSHFVTPDDFEGKFNTLWGCGFSIAPLFTQSAWFRFHNKSEELENLYFCGAGTHPGAGVPGVVASAQVIERLVPPSRDDSLQDLKALFVSKSKTFSLASFLLPKAQSDAVFRLYFVCRSLDDWADEGNADKLNDSMEAWKQNQPHAILDHYRFLQARWGLDNDPLTKLMQAMLREQEGVRVQSEEELIEFCYGVAGTIGLMLCPIFGAKDKEALEHAKNLGIAMQLTNICRDVSEDAENDRIYLPASLFEGGITTTEILSDSTKIRNRTVAAKEHLLQMADELYASSQAGIKHLPFRIRIVVRWAAIMYREIGAMIRRNPNHFHKDRAVVKRPKKMYFLIQCLARSLFSK